MFVFHLLFSLLLLVPAWRIADRAGLSPLISLLVIVPVIGPLLTMALLAFMPWRGDGRGDSRGDGPTEGRTADGESQP